MKISWSWVTEAIRTLSPIALTITAIALTLIIWIGGWPIETSESRVQWLGIALIANIALLGLSIFLNRAGISSFTVRGGPVEVSLNDNKDSD